MYRSETVGMEVCFSSEEVLSIDVLDDTLMALRSPGTSLISVASDESLGS
jgi:hypothetical protein